MKAKSVKVKQKKRNGHAFHPIMIKGGVHEKSIGAKRQASKRKWKKEQGECTNRSPEPLFLLCA